MLFIQKYDETVLPEEFHFINNVCAILYDQIVDLYRFKDYENFNIHKIYFDNNFNKEEISSFKSTEELLQYLLSNKMHDKLTDALTKHVATAVISDLSNFIYEAISAASKCKVTVAFSLLRKPFTDELTLLERLFIEPKTFIENFYIEGDIKKYDPSNNFTSNKLDHFQLTKKCVSKLKFNSFLYPTLVHDLRYDKSFPGAIQELTNKSIHIVTNHKDYKTEAKSLNYIFDAVTNIDQYLGTFYINTHYLLLYSAAVIDELYFRYLTDQEHHALRKSKALRRFFSLMLVRLTHEEDPDTSILKTVLTIFENNKMKCSNCKFEFIPTGIDLEFYFFEENIKCPDCLQFAINSDEEFESFVSRFDDILNNSEAC
ncbi:hypothetical protein [Arthrospiribacter ruber]|uniref:Uncharacterized protein n=1 Tax=Arthrospiribacter ruber TaxID=2487934 RepID=A0A951IW75_9BACT|nr:hypothetical protein [Arthrospiribacter ruber]MBW3467497.1 hypothetical protein [Arthrospiribacter ruber]